MRYGDVLLIPFLHSLELSLCFLVIFLCIRSIAFCVSRFFSYFVTFVAGAMLSECFLSLDLKQKAFFRYHLKQKTCFRYHRSAPRILYNYCML